MIKMKGRNKEKKQRNSFKFFKKHKKLSVILILVVISLGSFFVINYGRYVKNIIEVYYLRTKNFYFTSDKLTINGKTYEINPWGGTETYSITINMSSMLNSLKGTDSNISYNVDCSTKGNISCYFDTAGQTTDSRTITTNDHTDSFTVHVSPNGPLNNNNGEISVTIHAKSTSPYVEELSGKFKFVIGNYGLNYTIEDVASRVYFNSVVTNTLDTDTKKVKLTITDPTLVSIDMTDNILKGLSQQSNANNIGYTVVSLNTTDIHGNNTTANYIKTITFEIAPKSSLLVKFYKNNPNADYSFKMGQSGTPAVQFAVVEN